MNLTVASISLKHLLSKIYENGCNNLKLIYINMNLALDIKYMKMTKFNYIKTFSV